MEKWVAITIIICIVLLVITLIIGWGTIGKQMGLWLKLKEAPPGLGQIF